MIRALFLLLILAGCSTSGVRLQSPDGQLVTCGPYPTTRGTEAAIAPYLERGCVDDYQRQGFVRVP